MSRTEKMLADLRETQGAWLSEAVEDFDGMPQREQLELLFRVTTLCMQSARDVEDRIAKLN